MTEDEYRAKMTRILEIFEAVAGPQAEELDRLVDEVIEYEAENFPDPDFPDLLMP